MAVGELDRQPAALIVVHRAAARLELLDGDAEVVTLRDPRALERDELDDDALQRGATSRDLARGDLLISLKNLSRS